MRSSFALPVFALCASALPQAKRANDTSAEGLAQTTAILEATNAFLNSLTEDQQAQVLFTYDAAAVPAGVYVQGTGAVAERSFLAEGFGESMWTNYPYAYVPRPGVKLDNLTDAQSEAFSGLMSVMLSEEGYNKVKDIWASDEYIGRVAEENNVTLPWSSAPGQYAIGIHGEPSLENVWMIQVGGHHLGLNIALYQDQGVLAPAHTAIWPNIFEDAAGVERRGLVGECDKAFELYATLDESLRAQAAINHTVTELVQGPGMVNDTATEGVSVALFNDEQRALLLDIVSQWAGIINPVHGAPRLAEISAAFDETFFAWSGPATHEAGKNGESYYRVQGPNLFLEYSPQYLMGYEGLGEGFQGLTTHVHSTYRDPLRKYGRSFAA